MATIVFHHAVECDESMAVAAPDTAESSAEVTGTISELIRVEVEAVGKWFAEYKANHAKKDLFADLDDVATNTADDDSSDDDDDENDDGDVYVNISGEFKDQDHYGILGLGSVRWKATADDIKKAYRKMVLKHHPDKKGEMSKAEAKKADEYFSRIQKAYDLLSNPSARKLYDSVDDFDEFVPNILSKRERPEFFRLFGPIFCVNAKFIVQQPVPDLGDMSTPFSEVVKFYDFWTAATSWREFGYHDDEYNPDEAETREERRWMEKQNRAKRKKKKKVEVARLHRLVDNAYNSDPRIKRELKRQREEKEKEKQRRADERKRREEEAARQKREKEEAEERRIAEEKAKEKEKREAAKKLKRAFTKRCKRAGIYNVEGEPTGRVLTTDDMDKLKQYPVEKLGEWLEETSGDDSAFCTKVFAVVDGNDDATRKIDEAEQKRIKQAEQDAMPWTDEEQKLLEEALRKIPKTEDDRWGKIAACVPGRSKKACVARIKECVAKVKKQKENPDAPSQWTEEEELVLTKAVSKVYPPGTTGDRWALVADYLQIHGHTKWRRDPKTIIAKVREMKNVSKELRKKQTGSSATSEYSKFEKKKYKKTT